MGEISTSDSSAVEKMKQMLTDEFKMQQRVVRSTAVELQSLLKKTAVRLTNGLDSVYKERLLRLDEVASKMTSGDDVEEILSKGFFSDFLTANNLSVVHIRNAVESWNVSSSNGCADLRVPMSMPSFATGTEVRVEVGSGITKQGIFWLYLQELPDSNQLALADLYKRVSLEMIRDKEWKSFDELKSSPKVGDYVLVDVRNVWARGKIDKLKDDKNYAVRLIDYGELISCGTNLLFPMKNDFYPDADYQALRCCLSLDGNSLNIPIEAVWAFNDLLRENSVVKNPVMCIFKNKILDKDDEEIWQVDLMVKDKKEKAISISQAINKKIEDKARGIDAIACRDIRYSAKECNGSRYIERPAEINSSQKLTVVVTEKTAETATPSDEQQDARSVGNGLHSLMRGEQLPGEKQQPVLLEIPAPTTDGVSCNDGSRSVTDSQCHVSSPYQSAIPEENPEEHSLLDEQSVLPSTMPLAFLLDIQHSPCSAPSYSQSIAFSESLAASVEKCSTLKPDAAPFVSRSQTSLDSLTKPAPFSTDDQFSYQPENFSDCIPQEESVMDMHQYFAPAMSLQVQFPNYVDIKPLEFGANVPPVMTRMIYENPGSAYSYMPPMFNASCMPTYPVQEELTQSSYSRQDTNAPASERKPEELKQAGHLLPAVCSTKGAEFSGQVTGQMEADGTFWMQLSRNDQKEVDAWNQLQATLNTCNKLTLPVASEEVLPGLMVTVPSSQRGELCRAEVLSIKDRKAVLRCIDYGKTIVAPKDTLKPLVDKVRSFPRQAVKCRLYDPSSDGGRCFDQTARKLFGSLVKSGAMMATVVSVEAGNPETLMVKLRDSFGRNVVEEILAQSHFSERLSSHDDLGLSLMQQSLGAFAASATLSDSAAMSSAVPVFPLNHSQQSSTLCEPVKKLMAGVRDGPASLADVAHASLALRCVTCDLNVPPPPLPPSSMFAQMGDGCNRMMLTQQLIPSDVQSEWNNQQTQVENQTSPPIEASTEAPKDGYGQSRRGPWQQHYRDDELRSTTPVNMWDDGNESRQPSADDDKAKPDRKYTRCYNCGIFGHKKSFCPLLPQSKKTHGLGRPDSRK